MTYLIRCIREKYDLALLLLLSRFVIYELGILILVVLCLKFKIVFLFLFKYIPNNFYTRRVCVCVYTFTSKRKFTITNTNTYKYCNNVSIIPK